MLATLLSIILVVGLSPFGQAPAKAWADSKELSTYCYVTVDSGIAYKGSSWLTSSADGLLGSSGKIHVWKADGDTEIDNPTSDGNIASATYKDANGNAVTSIVDAGTYSVTLTGAGGYAGTTVTQSFTVEPYDISGATWTAEAGTSTTYPYVDIYGNLDAKTYDGSYQATAPTSAKFHYKNDSNAAASVDIPVTTTPATVKDFTSGTTVTAAATGNFTGSVTATAKVSRGTFAGAANRATVTGLTWANTSSPDYKTGKFDDQTYGATSDPVTAVTYGADADPLTRNTNYTVTYQRTADGSGAAVTEDATTTAPSELGAYTVTIAGAGNNFDTSSADNAITATYSIVAAGVDAAKVTFDDGTYAGGAAVEADPDTARVFTSEGLDVTASAGTVAVQSYAVWSANLEKAYLGDDAYLAQYGAAGYPTSSIGTLDSSSKPATAGDYAVSVKVGGTTIENMKFTVDPAALSEGTSVGDLLVDTSVSASTTAEQKNVYDGNGTITTPPSVGIITAVDASGTTPSYTTTKLAANTDYTVAYYQDGEEVTPKAAGTYDAVFTFKGGMEGSNPITAEAALVINALPISTAVSSVSFADKMYTGAGVDAAPAFTMGSGYSSVTLTTDDYALSYDAGASGTLSADGKPLIPATTYKVTVSGQGNYTGSLTAAEFSVTALDISDTAYTTVQFQQDDGTWADSYRTLFVSGGTYEPAVRLVTAATASDASPTVIPPSLYTVSYSDNATAGTATVTLASVSGSDYVTASKTRTASFYLTTSTFAADGGAVALSASNVDYVPGNTTTSLTPTVTVSTTSKGVLTDDYYTVAVTDSEGEIVSTVTEAGTYTVTVTGGTNGYYAGELSATFTVDPFEIEQDDVYDASATSPSGTVYITTPSSLPYTGEELTGITKAEYYKGGYSATATATATLYDSEADENPSCTVTGATATDAGTYTATLEFSGNYTGTVTKTWEVTALDSTSLTFYLDGLNWTTKTVGSTTTTQAVDLYAPAYTGSAWAPAVTIFKGTEDVTSDVAPTVIYEDNVNAGDAAITVIASGNYAFNIELGFAISKIDLEAALAAGTLDVAFADAAYTGSAVEPVPTISFSASDGTTYELGADDYAISYDGAPVNAGSTGTATIVGKGNFGSHNQMANNGNVGYITATYTVTQADQAIAASATSVKPVFKKSSTVTIEGAKGELTATPSNGTGSVSVKVDGNKVVITGTKAGSASVKIAAAASADGNYAASDPIIVNVTVAKAANTLKVANAKRTVSAKALAKKAKKINGVKVSTKGQGTMVYKVTKVTKGKKSVAKKNFKVAKSSANKITVAKGLAKGTYKVTMTAKAKGNANYNASKVLKKVVTVVVK